MTCTYPESACSSPVVVIPKDGSSLARTVHHVSSGVLPFTGADVLMLVVCGALLLVAGLALLAGCRFRVH